MEVRFTGGMFGSFMQWVTFDFGSRPVLVRKLNVELGIQIMQEKVQQLRKQLHFFRCVSSWKDDQCEGSRLFSWIVLVWSGCAFCL